MRWPKGGLLWLVPPIFIVLHALVIAPTLPHYVLMSAGALMGFALWMWALGQVDLDVRDWYRFAQLVWGGVLILVLLALPSANYWNRPEWIEWLPGPLRRAEGGFQQRNVFASFIAASLMWVWLLRLQVRGPRFAMLRGLFYLSVFLAAWMVLLSGSRTGSVALLASFAASLVYGIWIKADRVDLIGGAWRC